MKFPGLLTTYCSNSGAWADRKMWSFVDKSFVVSWTVSWTSMIGKSQQETEIPLDDYLSWMSLGFRHWVSVEWTP